MAPTKLEVDPHHVLGVMLALRHLLPKLMPLVKPGYSTLTNTSKGATPEAAPPTLDRILQIFELLLHYVDHSDHNVVTASLETFQQFLKSASPAVVRRLSSPGVFPGSTFQGHTMRDRSESTRLKTRLVLCLEFSFQGC